MSSQDEPRLTGPAVFFDGPFRELRPSGRFDRYYRATGAGSILIPLNEKLEYTEAEAPFAFACYGAIGHSKSAFLFRGYWRPDGQPFMVRFKGGHMDGEHPYHKPVEELPVLLVPLPRSSTSSTEGRLRAFAYYERKGKALVFKENQESITTDLRIIVELSGGPSDGRVMDSDAQGFDDFGAVSAQGYYAVWRESGKKIGKIILVAAPYSIYQIEKFGRDAPLMQMHEYRISEAIEEPFEVLIRAEYVGVHNSEKKKPSA